MPNGSEHRRTSGLVGGVFAGSAALAAGAQPLQLVCESAGGYFAGRLTGSLPDVIDPATCWYHRDIGHAMVPVGAGLTWYAGQANDWQHFCREQGRLAEVASALAESPLEAFGYLCRAIRWYLAAGAIVGAPVGYAVHVLQDSFTLQGVPMLLRGC